MVQKNVQRISDADEVRIDMSMARTLPKKWMFDRMPDVVSTDDLVLRLVSIYLINP